jgi:cytochrome b
MVLALMACVIGLALTGWLYTTDRFFGDETVDAIHQVLAWTLLALIAAHLLGVIFTSLRHRENLVRAMFDGRKPAPRETDIA